MVALEALRARHGDCLLLHFGSATEPGLVLIDGGPSGVFKDALQPRLEELRVERGLGADEPLDLDLVMVSHIDDDHVAGLLQMTRRMVELADAGEPQPWRIHRCWHNAFDDLLDNDEIAFGTPASMANAASLGGLLAPGGESLLASVAQGRDLGKALERLGLAGNRPIGGLVRAGSGPVRLANLQLTVVAPRESELRALQDDWNRRIKPILARERSDAGLAQIAAYLDRSVYNLSSLVVLAEADGWRLLLTGDGRGDHTLKGLEEAGLLDDEGRLAVDVLKVPHHGSVRDVDLDYFERIRARHYVVSADGRHDNPDVETLDLLAEARPDDDFTIHLTYPLDEFAVPEIGEAIGEWIAEQRQAGRSFAVATRASGERGLRVEPT